MISDQELIQKAVQDAFNEGLWEDMLVKTYYEEDGTIVVDFTELDALIMKSEDREIWIQKFGLGAVLNAARVGVPLVFKRGGQVVRHPKETVRAVVAAVKDPDGIVATLRSPTKTKDALANVKNWTPGQIISGVDKVLGTSIKRGLQPTAPGPRIVRGVTGAVKRGTGAAKTAAGNVRERLPASLSRGPKPKPQGGQPPIPRTSRITQAQQQAKPKYTKPLTERARERASKLGQGAKQGAKDVVVRPAELLARTPIIRRIPGAEKLGSGAASKWVSIPLNTAAGVAGYHGLSYVDDIVDAVTSPKETAKKVGSKLGDIWGDPYEEFMDAANWVVPGRTRLEPFPEAHKPKDPVTGKRVAGQGPGSWGDMSNKAAKERMEQAEKEYADKGTQSTASVNPISTHTAAGVPREQLTATEIAQANKHNAEVAAKIKQQQDRAAKDPNVQQHMGRPVSSAHVGQMQEDYKRTAQKLLKQQDIRNIVKEAVLNNTMPELATTSMPTTAAEMPVSVFNESVKSLQDQNLPPVNTKPKELKEDVEKITEGVIKKLMKAPPAASKQDVAQAIRAATRMQAKEPRGTGRHLIDQPMQDDGGSSEARNIGQHWLEGVVWGWGGDLAEKLIRDQREKGIRNLEFHPETGIPLDPKTGEQMTPEQVQDFYTDTLATMDKNPEWQGRQGNPQPEQKVIPMPSREG